MIDLCRSMRIRPDETKITVMDELLDRDCRKMRIYIMGLESVYAENVRCHHMGNKIIHFSQQYFFLTMGALAQMKIL